MDWTSKVYDRNMIDGQSFQEQTAAKARAYDNLEKQYVAKQVAGLAADKAALMEYMRPMFAQRTAEVMNQGGNYVPAEQIPYQQGEYVLPDNGGLASERFRNDR